MAAISRFAVLMSGGAMPALLGRPGIAQGVDTRDLRAQLTDLKSLSPEAIVITGYYPEVALIVRQARQLGIKSAFLGGDGWDGASLIPVAGKSIEGCIVSTALFLRSDGGLAGGFGASPTAAENCKAMCAPSGRTALGAASGSVFCAEVLEATPSTD